MSDYIVKSEEYKGFTINVNQDEDVENPRSWSPIGTMCYRHKDYTLGDKVIPETYINEKGEDIFIENEDDFKTWFEYMFGEIAVILPLYLYDHSGITMKTTPFGDRWDSGQVGWIAISKDTVRAEYGVKKVTKALLEKVKTVLEGEVKVFDDYISGEVYRYEIMRDEDEFVDGCGGYYGYEGIKEAIEQAKEDIDSLLKNQPDTWKVTVELTVFAGDMDKDNVISNAKKILSDITDGTDFTSYSVVDAKRDL